MLDSAQPKRIYDPNSIRQWTIVGIVGIVLGIYAVLVSSLSPPWAILFVVAVLFPFIAMIVGNLRKLLLTLIILDIPLQLDIHPGYRTEAAGLGALAGWSISITTLSLVVLYALWLGELVTKAEPRSRPLLRVNLPLALYLAFAALSLVVARDVTLSLFEVFLLSQMFLLYIYIASTVRTRQDVVFIVTMLFTGLVLESLIMIGLGYVGQSFSVAGISGRIDVARGATEQFSRTAGTIGSPNTAASYLMFLLTPALSVLITPLGRGYKWLAALAFGLGGMSLILTLSRGAWIAFALSVTILCVSAWRRGWLPRTVPFILVVVVALASLLFYSAISARLLGYDLGSAYSRVPLMKLAFRMIEDNPVLGVGANNFGLATKEYITPELRGEFLWAAHNKYLLVWAEIGTGGVLAFIWFLLTTARQGWQGWKVSDRFLSPLALGFMAAVVGQMAHMFVDVFHSRPQVQLLWLIAGLLTAVSSMGSAEAKATMDYP